MGYGIYRVEKRHAADTKGIQIHNNREKIGKSSNQDINWDKTKDNIHLVPCDDLNKAIEVELSTLKRKPRKDAVVMLEHLVTSSQADMMKLSQEEQLKFFQNALEQIQKEFGHVISATIHMDEETPHMHVCSVPITQDNRLSAKDLIGNRKQMSALQDRMYENVFKPYGLERGTTYNEKLEKGEDVPKHKTVAQLKHETNMELDALNQQIQENMDLIEITDQDIMEKNNELGKLNAAIDETQKQVDYLNNELAALEQFQNTLTRDLRLLELQSREPIEILAETEEKTRFGKTMPATVTIRKDDYDKFAKLQTINKQTTHIQTVLNSFLNGSKSLLGRLEGDLHLQAIKNAFNGKIRHLNNEFDNYKKSASALLQDNNKLKHKLDFDEKILKSVENEISTSRIRRIKAKICKRDYESSWHDKNKTDKALGINTNKVFMPIDSMEPIEELDFLKAYKSYCNELGEQMDQDMAAQYDQLLQIDKAIDEVMLESFAEWHQEQGRGR